MSEQKYELAFYGKLVEGSDLLETKQLVAQLFKTTVEQIERMFTGNRVVIRNKLDEVTAKKYIDALKKRGAMCQIELMGEPGVAVNFDTPSPAPAPVTPPPPVSEPASAISTGATAQVNPSPTEKKSSAKAAMSLNGLPIVGEKVDEILSATHMDLAPVGVRLEEEKNIVAPELHALDDVDLAPVGSILLDQPEKPPVAAPDTSHIQMAPKDS